MLKNIIFSKSLVLYNSEFKIEVSRKNKKLKVCKSVIDEKYSKHNILFCEKECETSFIKPLISKAGFLIDVFNISFVKENILVRNIDKKLLKVISNEIFIGEESIKIYKEIIKTDEKLNSLKKLYIGGLNNQTKTSVDGTIKPQNIKKAIKTEEFNYRIKCEKFFTAYKLLFENVFFINSHLKMLDLEIKFHNQETREPNDINALPSFYLVRILSDGTVDKRFYIGDKEKNIIAFLFFVSNLKKASIKSRRLIFDVSTFNICEDFKNLFADIFCKVSEKYKQMFLLTNNQFFAKNIYAKLILYDTKSFKVSKQGQRIIITNSEIEFEAMSFIISELKKLNALILGNSFNDYQRLKLMMRLTPNIRNILKAKLICRVYA